jgi:hypothetical protein
MSTNENFRKWFQSKSSIFKNVIAREKCYLCIMSKTVHSVLCERIYKVFKSEKNVHEIIMNTIYKKE